MDKKRWFKNYKKHKLWIFIFENRLFQFGGKIKAFPECAGCEETSKSRGSCKKRKWTTSVSDLNIKSSQMSPKYKHKQLQWPTGVKIPCTSLSNDLCCIILLFFGLKGRYTPTWDQRTRTEGVPTFPDFYVSYVAWVGYAARLRTHRKYFSRRVAITVLTSRQR